MMVYCAWLVLTRILMSLKIIILINPGSPTSGQDAVTKTEFFSPA